MDKLKKRFSDCDQVILVKRSKHLRLNKQHGKMELSGTGKANSATQAAAATTKAVATATKAGASNASCTAPFGATSTSESGLTSAWKTTSTKAEAITSAAAGGEVFRRWNSAPEHYEETKTGARRTCIERPAADCVTPSKNEGSSQLFEQQHHCAKA